MFLWPERFLVIQWISACAKPNFLVNDCVYPIISLRFCPCKTYLFGGRLCLPLLSFQWSWFICLTTTVLYEKKKIAGALLKVDMELSRTPRSRWGFCVEFPGICWIFYDFLL